MIYFLLLLLVLQTPTFAQDKTKLRVHTRELALQIEKIQKALGIEHNYITEIYMTGIKQLYPVEGTMEIVQGQTFSEELRWWTDPETVKDLTGYTIQYEARENRRNPDTRVLWTADVADDSNVTCALNADPTTGRFIISITDTNSAALDFDTAFFNIVAYKDGEDTVILYAGTLTLIRTNKDS